MFDDDYYYDIPELAAAYRSFAMSMQKFVVIAIHSLTQVQCFDAQGIGASLWLGQGPTYQAT